MAPPPEVVFAKKLAGAEKYERDQGVRRLTKWLKIRSMGDNSFTDEEMLRVWKGLFYCYWMSDKMLIQEELAENISNIIDVFGNKKATLSYIKCFMITMGREWYGLDKWRKDKYLQLIRRFVRKIFKYNKAKNWDKNIARDLAKHFRTKCFTSSNIANGIGFQLQVIDVYMEELAKVGGEEVSQEIIEIYLEPAFKVIWKGQDFRLVEAAKVRIFEYLMRQSDCGIRFEAEKEARHIINHSKEKVVDIIKEEDLEKDEGIDLDVCDKMETDNFVNVETPAEDPRGGNVSVEIPQLQLDYNRLADKCFEHGSGIKTSESARTILYTLSKQFKDVANDEFPLSGELDEEMKARLEAAKIPIDTDESAKKLLKIKMRVEANLKKEQAEAKKIFKERMKKEREAQKEKDKELAKYYDDYEEEEDGEGGSEDEERDYDQKNSLKRKSEDQEESEEESPEAKKARIEENKERRKEMQRKHKREQQRRKRERKLAEELAKQEELRLSQVDIDRDIDIQSVLTQEKPKEKKKVKKEKVASPKVNITKDSPESDEKVAKKNKKVQLQETNSLAIKVQEKSEEEQNLFKKKKKKEKNDKKAGLEIVKPVFNDSVVESPVPKKKKDKKAAVEPEPVKPTLNESTDASSVPKKKKKDKKAAVEPEPVKPILNKSVDESSEPKKKKKKEKTDKLEPEPQKPIALQTEPQSEGSVKKKKDKKKKRESVAGDEKIAENVQSEKKKDKKEKKVNVDTTGGAKLFAESDDWDTPAPEEKQDPVGFKDFAAPTLTTPGKNTHTAMFLKKALSKSNTPKKKLSQIEKLKSKGSSSESKAKRVNWALTKNMSTSERELLLSIKSSPGIPHDPRKKPEKGLLKTKTMPRTPQNENPVQLNTQLNSISKKGLKMAMKFERMAAKDFFF